MSQNNGVNGKKIGMKRAKERANREGKGLLRRKGLTEKGRAN